FFFLLEIAAARSPPRGYVLLLRGLFFDFIVRQDALALLLRLSFQRLLGSREFGDGRLIIMVIGPLRFGLLVADRLLQLRQPAGALVTELNQFADKVSFVLDHG